MSHLLNAPLKVLDIAALRTVAQSFGAHFAEKKTFHSYQGETKCDYVIALPTVKYEVGVVKQPDGSFALVHDPFGYENSHGHDGHKLVAAFGENLCKLTQAYTRQVVTAKARAKGWCVQEKKLSDGRLQLNLVRA